MKIKILVFSVMTLSPMIGSASVCHWTASSMYPLAPNTSFDTGPNVYNALIANPNVSQALSNGRDAWDVTDAFDRIGGLSGTVLASDCPTSLTNMLGALSFSTTTCLSVAGDPALAITFAYSGGVKAFLINLDYPWSAAPSPTAASSAGTYDLQSIAAHEFGHVLGMDHQFSGACGVSAPTYSSCATHPNRETMSPDFTQMFLGLPGTGPEHCERDLEPNDEASANALY